MSYSILYRSMFVKLSDGRFIPMMEMGDNNVYDASWRGRARRSRSWSNMNLNKGQKFFTKEEIVKYLNEWNDECEQQRERYRNSDDAWQREHADKANFGFFEAIAVYGKGGTWGTKFNDVKNIVLSGINNAITVEEAVKNCGLKITYWQSGEGISYFDRQQYVRFETEEEMFAIIEEKFSNSGYYFVYNENNMMNKFYSMRKAMKGFLKLSGRKCEKFILCCSDNGYKDKKYVAVDNNGVFYLTEDISKARMFNLYESNGVGISTLIYYLFKDVRSIHYIYERELKKEVA